MSCSLSLRRLRPWRVGPVGEQVVGGEGGGGDVAGDVRQPPAVRAGVAAQRQVGLVHVQVAEFGQDTFGLLDDER
jgi:hypothetical protein